MSPTTEQKAVLLLEDGTVYHGQAAGAIGTTTGEICFNTGMTGYQEVFTDPSYHGQILVMTNVHIGNYGTRAAEQESGKVQIQGLICRNFTVPYSRTMADKSIQQYAEDENLIAIQGIDTRALVTHIRSKGVMNAIISSENVSLEELKQRLKSTPSMEGLELASKVTTSEVYDFGDPTAQLKIAVLDIGTKTNILRCLSDRGAFLRVFPAETTFEVMNEWNPDGFFLSNGPGDPSTMEYAIQAVKKMINSNKPVFGICLGHQILSLALGLETYKMHNGHRGANHPVINKLTGKCEITSQNHGFAVRAPEGNDLSDVLEITHINLNDNTVEGLRSKIGRAFSVQFHPEAAPGPHDSRYLFDQFINVLEKEEVEA